MNKKTLINIFIGFAVGIVISLSFIELFQANSDSENKPSKKEPLYWVAPMDESYRRDKPGKSPMGMDLVPVYDESGSDKDSPGTIKIHPNVINNLSVKTEKVSKAPLTHTIRTVGYVTYNETSLVQIHSRTEGWVERLFVNHNGEFIKAGQPLYELYSPVLVNAQEEYLLSKKRNNGSLLKAAKQRLESLGFSQTEFKKLNSTGKAAKNVTFYAKSDGLIDDLNIREGVFIKPEVRLMTIGSLDNVWIDVELFERQLPFVKLGQKAKMTLKSLPEKEWVGEVNYVYPIVDANNRTAKVRLEFSNSERLLKPNMFTEVSIIADSKNSVLQVPTQAVIRTEGSNRVVLSLDDGKFKSVKVKTGKATSRSIEIIEGLAEGDKVVVSGQFLIDSESSINSDFKRFSSNNKEDNDSPPTATVNGVINTIDLNKEVVNISRDAIPKWNRAPATMDFKLSQSIDISSLTVGDKINFMFEVRKDGFFITMIHDNTTMEH